MESLLAKVAADHGVDATDFLKDFDALLLNGGRDHRFGFCCIATIQQKAENAKKISLFESHLTNFPYTRPGG